MVFVMCYSDCIPIKWLFVICCVTLQAGPIGAGIVVGLIYRIIFLTGPLPEEVLAAQRMKFGPSSGKSAPEPALVNGTGNNNVAPGLSARAGSLAV